MNQKILQSNSASLDIKNQFDGWWIDRKVSHKTAQPWMRWQFWEFLPKNGSECCPCWPKFCKNIDQAVRIFLSYLFGDDQKSICLVACWPLNSLNGGDFERRQLQSQITHHFFSVRCNINHYHKEQRSTFLKVGNVRVFPKTFFFSSYSQDCYMIKFPIDSNEINRFTNIPKGDLGIIIQHIQSIRVGYRS